MHELLKKWYHKKVDIILGRLQVTVVIMDVKITYGKTRFLVSPVAGKGEIYVENFIGLNA